ncbi:MAG TPA: hypothetical protein VM050_04530 [Patescibacteria group bacterium]|nr:hypothetical protein [Patescibacteria group bacterium]
MATRLREAVERNWLKELKRKEVDLIQLPPYPRVEVHGNSIIIISEDNDKEIWDEEADEISAHAIANELEIGLRAINYVKYSLVNYVSTLSEDLQRLNVPEESIDDIVYEGYNSLKKWFNELERTSSHYADE